jgi:ribosomal protein L32
MYFVSWPETYCQHDFSKKTSPYKENAKRSNNADLIRKNLYCSFQFGSSRFAVESSVITVVEVCGALQLSSHVCV